MNIKMNDYRNQISYAAMPDERASKHRGEGKTESEARSGTNKDTVSISIAGQQFAAEQMVSDSEMGLVRITSDLDSFRNAVSSMKESLQESLPVSWEAMVDPYGTFASLFKAESRLRQSADPAASKKDEDMERIADEYAKSKIDLLIEKRKPC